MHVNGKIILTVKREWAFHEDFTRGVIHTDLEKNRRDSTKHTFVSYWTDITETAQAAAPKTADREQHWDQQLNVARHELKEVQKTISVREETIPETQAIYNINNITFSFWLWNLTNATSSFFPWRRTSKYKAKSWCQINNSNIFTSPITTAATEIHPACLNLDEWEIKVLKIKKVNSVTSCTLSNILLHKQVPEKTEKKSNGTPRAHSSALEVQDEKNHSSVGLSSAQKHSSTSASVSCLWPLCLIQIMEISAALDPNTVLIIPVPLFHHEMSSGMLGILVKRQWLSPNELWKPVTATSVCS